MSKSPLPVSLADEELDEWEILGNQDQEAPVVSEVVPVVSEVPGPASGTWSSSLKFWVNGEQQILENPNPSLFLVDWLREVKGLTGTKVGCHAGHCGACTVALAFGSDRTGQVVPAMSCSRRVVLLDGCHVTTTEGLGTQATGFHAVQTAIADGNGSQCGYCTPGWVMQMYSLLHQNDTPSRKEIEEQFDGNICRCTGYRPILGAFGEFAEGGKRCGTSQNVPLPAGQWYHRPEPLHFTDPVTGQEWYRPILLSQIADIRKAAAASGKPMVYIAAGTVSGNNASTVYVDLTGIPDLQVMDFDAERGLTCGSAMSIEQAIQGLDAHSDSVPAYGRMATELKRVAASQLRSVMTWTGNVMSCRAWGGTAVSDIVTSFVAGGVLITVLEDGAVAAREVSVPELMTLAGDVLALSFRAPVDACSSTGTLRIFKTGQRASHAQRIVCFGGYLDTDAAGVVTDARLVCLGAAATMLVPQTAINAIMGQTLNVDTFKEASAALLVEVRANPSGDPLHTAAYRESLAVGFLYKLFLAAQKNLPPEFDSADVPMITPAARPVSSGTEAYGTVAADGPVGTHVPKLSSKLQASGEATYPSDSALGALFGQVVFSSAAATLQSLDPSEALGMPGVVNFVSAHDIPGLNSIAFTLDTPEKVFFEVGDQIPCIGVQLGMVVATTWQEANAAASKVKQVYTPSSSGGMVVASLEHARVLGRVPTQADVKRADKILGRPRYRARRGIKPTLMRGAAMSVGRPREEASQKLSATFKTGGQRHWQLETQSAVATPVDGRWEFLISDQDPDFSATNLAKVLGVPMHHVNCICRRAGGGFGAKLTRQVPLAAACGVAARKLRRPVRAQNMRDQDTAAVAGREPMWFNYDVTFDSSGKVDTMDLNIDVDMGWCISDNSGDLFMAQQWADNCFNYSGGFKVATNPLITDTPCTTSMRAPGCMQSLIASVQVMEHVAKTVGKTTDEVMELNFYNIGDTTPFGDTLGEDGYNWTIPQLWAQIQQDANYEARKQAVADFNASNRWRKKGIAMCPVKYIADISWYSSGAHICVYHDGTVLVSHGGCEIGQGINTKVALVVAQTLGVPLENISVGTTETAKVPNNTATGGSGTSECSAKAAIMAAEEIVSRLEEYRKTMAWEDAIAQANEDGVSLMASSWFKAGQTSNADEYATYGTAISEVLVDVLTGEVRVEQADVLMDFGTQLDAAVDLGQTQGGFVMALGYLFTEQLIVDQQGKQLQASTYEVPGAYDIPLVFNCSLLKDTPNPTGVKGSKLVAEPVMALAAAPYLAVKEAIYAARKEVGLGDDWFMLDLPCTPEVICAAIGTPADQFTIPSTK